MEILGVHGGRFDSLGVFDRIGLSHSTGLMPQKLQSPGNSYSSLLYGLVAYKDEVHFFGNTPQQCGIFNLNTGEMKYIETVIPWTSSISHAIGDGNPYNPKRLRILATNTMAANVAKWYDATTRMHSDCAMRCVSNTHTMYGKSGIFTFRDMNTSDENHEVYKYDPDTNTETYIGKFNFTNNYAVWSFCHIGNDQFYVFVRSDNSSMLTDVYLFNGNNGNLSKIVTDASWMADNEGGSQDKFNTPVFCGLVKCFYGGGDKIYLYSTSRPYEARPWIWAEYSMSNKKFKVLITQDEFTTKGQSRCWCWDMIEPGVLVTAQMNNTPISLSITKFTNPSVGEYRG